MLNLFAYLNDQSQDLRGVAHACCQAAAALHTDGIVHCDFRMANVVRLDADSWMVIDLEYCRRARDPLLTKLRLVEWDDVTLAKWDDGITTKARKGQTARWYTELSDMYQIGGLLRQHLQDTFSGDAKGFVSALRKKTLKADEALKHTWLSTRA